METLKELVESILPHERELFLFLNGAHTVFWDHVMWIISKTNIWFPFYGLVILFLFYKTSWKQAALALLFFVLMAVLCDQISSGLIKPYFERLRPTHHPDFKDYVTIVNGYRAKGFSFISGHATNSLGFAVFLSLLYRHRWVTVIAFIWALSISYSRIYLGVHFISDVVTGMVVGTLVGLFSYSMLTAVRKRVFHLEGVGKTQLYPPQHGKIMALIFLVYFIGVVLFGILSP